VPSTRIIDDFLLVRVDSKGHNNKRIYGLTGPSAKHVRQQFENDFQPEFHYLEQHRHDIPLDEFYHRCRQLHSKYLDEKSIAFPYSQRSTYLTRWQHLLPDKKHLRKYLLDQLNNNIEQNFIQSHVDLPIYDIGYMLLRYNDANRTRQSQPYVIYVNYEQRLVLVYLKNVRQRQCLIDLLTTRFPLIFNTNFDNYDEQTRDLFTSTKKLLVFRTHDNESFDKLNFSRISAELFA
jgi:hypothetical protein